MGLGWVVTVTPFPPRPLQREAGWESWAWAQGAGVALTRCFMAPGSSVSVREMKAVMGPTVQHCWEDSTSSPGEALRTVPGTQDSTLGFTFPIEVFVLISNEHSLVTT